MTEKNLFDELQHDSLVDESSNDNRWLRAKESWQESIASQWDVLSNDRLVVYSVISLLFFSILAIFGPLIAPYGPTERVYDSSGMVRYAPPVFLGGDSPAILGTTPHGYDIFSQLLYGARPTIIIGLVAAVITTTVGTIVGLTSGYYGGRIDDLLMRIVDFAYGLPMLPTVILMVALLGPSYLNIIIAIVLLQWRSSARVIRSQVLSVRQRQFVKSAKVAGASDRRIIVKHIAPNILPLAVLYGAFAMAWAILTEAGVSFLGLGDPEHVSYGVMLNNSFTHNAMMHGAWWWFIPPGLFIVVIVLSGFLIGRGYEEVANPTLRKK